MPELSTFDTEDVTEFAQRAFMQAERLELELDRINQDPGELLGFRVRVTRPEYGTTGGGLRARQHVVAFLPGQDFQVVVGAIDTTAGIVCIYDWDSVAYRARRLREAEIPIAVYEALARGVRGFAQKSGLTVALVRDAPTTHRRTPGPWILAVAAAAITVLALLAS